MLTAIIVVYLFGLGVLALVSLWWFRREVERAAIARRLLARRMVRTARRVAGLSKALRGRATSADAGRATEAAESDPLWQAALELLRPRYEAPPALRERVLRLVAEDLAKKRIEKPDHG